MAGDWIKIRTNLCGDPAVKAISRTLKLDVFSVVGRLHEFWAWADQHTESGLMEFTVLEDVDDVVQKRGFASEMVRVGWLMDHGLEGVEIPKWDRHNGENAKKRCQAQVRKREQRTRESHALELDLSRSERDNGVTELGQARDQRREEKSNTPVSPQGDVQSADLPELLLIRAKGLFTKNPVRLPITLDRSQLLAWKKNKAAVFEASEEDWRLLEEAYAQTDGDACRFRRKDLAQLLNNWNGEITRAQDWKKKAGLSWAAVSRPVVEPDGWQEALEEIYPDASTDLAWMDLSADVRAQILENLQKKKGRGNEQE